MDARRAPLVSVIIPCFNKAAWLPAAIESCFAQTHPSIEVIVVDDGSTDASAEIIRRYADRIICLRTTNRGANHARSRGLELARGAYIQYLDADDYLLPHKVARQVACLETTGAEIVYGDVLYQYHRPDSSTAVELAAYWGLTARDQELADRDPLITLLTYGCLGGMAYLYRREVVERSPGWDETIGGNQNRAFLIGVLSAGARIVYQPGADSVYRRYGDVTLSTTNIERQQQWFGHVSLWARRELRRSGRLGPAHLRALARSFLLRARRHHASISLQTYSRFMLLSALLATEAAALRVTRRARTLLPDQSTTF